MTVNEPATPKAEEVEPTTILPPKGYGWIARARSPEVATYALPISVVAALALGYLEQVPLTEGLTFERVNPKVRRAR